MKRVAALGARFTHSIIIDNREVPVDIKRHPGARAMRLRYDAQSGMVRITVPPDIGDRAAMSLARGHIPWLRAQIADAIAPIRLGNGIEIAFEGHDRQIIWRSDLPRRPSLDEGSILLGGEEEAVERRLLQWLKQQARARFADDIAHYCGQVGKAVPHLSIGDARTRWGSCSLRSGIRLNWRLVMAPTTVRRSVVAHEVSHLTHMNHSARFYEHLDQLFEGDRKSCDDWLKANSAGLRAVAARARL